jgi:type VI secretion system protein
VRAILDSRSVVRPLILVLLLVATASCGLPNRVRSMFGGQIPPIPVTISKDANENSPLAVELIVAYDQKVLDELLKMPARKWFDGREQFLRDHPEAVETLKREWTPGQDVAPLEISYGVGARRVVIFADYLVPGDHRATIDPQQRFKLVLGDDDLAVEALR